MFEHAQDTEETIDASSNAEAQPSHVDQAEPPIDADDGNATNESESAQIHQHSRQVDEDVPTAAPTSAQSPHVAGGMTPPAHGFSDHEGAALHARLLGHPRAVMRFMRARRQ